MDLKDAIPAYDNGILSVAQFTEIVRENQQNGIFWIPNGKNESRFGFTHHHIFTIRGRFFQDRLKKYILKSIENIHKSDLTRTDLRLLHISVNLIHFSWKRIYDKDAFQYSDPRLNSLDAFIKGFISTEIENQYPYDHKFMFKLVDIGLGIAYEDNYYRSRMIDFADTFRKAYTDKSKAVSLKEVEKFTRDYITNNFKHCYPYKHDFMNKIVDILLNIFEDKMILTDFVQKYRIEFPDMLIAPAEKDNLRRWN